MSIKIPERIQKKLKMGCFWIEKPEIEGEGFLLYTFIYLEFVQCACITYFLNNKN